MKLLRISVVFLSLIDKEKENFNISLMIQEVLTLLEKPLADNDIMVCFDPFEKFEFFGYKNELKQIIFNIVNNSKDAIESNGITSGKITFSIKQDERKIVIRIKDNGGGISKDVIQKIYEPYFTTKHKSKGTGIGLYMCKMIIEESFGGTIRLFNYKDGVVNEIILNMDKEEI